jgi:hypothetical protein
LLDRRLPKSETGHEDHGWHRHHVGVYAGGAYRGAHHENGWLLEGEYEYRFRRNLGVGAVAERTFSVEGDPWLFVFPLALHPAGGLRLATGPGIEFEDGESGNFVWRFGLGWDFDLGRNFFLTPAANADLSEGHWSFTYGIQLGYGF